MPVMAMMMVVVPVVVMTPVVVVPVMVAVVVMMSAPVGLLHESGGRLAVRQHLRHGRRSLSLRRHHRPSQDGCGR
jgi:hypothetical protein